MLNERELQVYDRMRQYGGAFVKALAETWLRADPTNKEKLEGVFGAYFTEYASDYDHKPVPG